MKVVFLFHTSPNYHAVDIVEEYNDVYSTKLNSVITPLRWHLISNNNVVYRDLDKILMTEDQETLDVKYDKETDIDMIGSHALQTHTPNLITKRKQKIFIYTASH